MQCQQFRVTSGHSQPGATGSRDGLISSGAGGRGTLSALCLESHLPGAEMGTVPLPGVAWFGGGAALGPEAPSGLAKGQHTAEPA